VTPGLGEAISESSMAVGGEGIVQGGKGINTVLIVVRIGEGEGVQASFLLACSRGEKRKHQKVIIGIAWKKNLGLLDSAIIFRVVRKKCKKNQGKKVKARGLPLSKLPGVQEIKRGKRRIGLHHVGVED